MTNFLSKNLFGAFMSAALILFTSSLVHAENIEDRAEKIMNSPVAQCAKEGAKEIQDLLRNEVKASRDACKELRGCKKEARQEKRQCKQGCKGLKGKAKRQCKKECRQDKRAAKRSCKEAYKTAACVKARRSIVSRITKAVVKLAKSEKCREALANLKELK